MYFVEHLSCSCQVFSCGDKKVTNASSMWICHHFLHLHISHLPSPGLALRGDAPIRSFKCAAHPGKAFTIPVSLFSLKGQEGGASCGWRWRATSSSSSTVGPSGSELFEVTFEVQRSFGSASHSVDKETDSKTQNWGVCEGEQHVGFSEDCNSKQGQFL